MKKLTAFLATILILFGCSNNNPESINSDSALKEDNINEMIQIMKNIHKDCEGQSIHFRGSAERTAISMWDTKYPKQDVDEALKRLNPTLLTDDEIARERLGQTILNMSERVIE